MENLRTLVSDQSATTQLLPATIENLLRIYESPQTQSWAKESIEELVKNKEWTELNDRFYKQLAFGTGGIRGRSIGKVVTASEKGTPNSLGCPQHPAVGSNMFNQMNLRRATQGLGFYILRLFDKVTPKVVISHDTRHFSRNFAEEVSGTLNEMGIDTFIFHEERSTPQLSYSVRWLKAQAGVMITASHNPSHDNGFKAYFNDGAQLVESHASEVIAEVNKLDNQHASPSQKRAGRTTVLDQKADQVYLDAVSELVLEPKVIEQAGAQLKLVYTPLHGTGERIIPQLLERFGFQYSVVAAQAKPDGRFPTVQSPNPENAEALKLGIEQANAEKADVVLATDPDADRMGVAVRNSKGEMELLNGNQIGSMLAYYRCERFFAKKILNEKNRQRATLIKTFVTTDLQKKIAEHFGVKCVETLTGFKYIGEKLHDYELACALPNYDQTPLEKRREAQLARGTFFIFGGEESYGYSGGDYVRDKDANAAVLMFAELAAWAKSQNKTVTDYLDDLYRKFGFFTEKLGTLTFEGAAGAAKIKKLLDSYRRQPPTELTKIQVTQIQDFGEQDYRDIDGKLIPKELMLIFHLENGSRMAVRASGTEPKIKFYFFTQASADAGLDEAKNKARHYLDAWWDEIQADVKKRIEG